MSGRARNGRSFGTVLLHSRTKSVGKSMNNSELSVAAPGPRTCVYPSSWDNASEELLQSDQTFDNERSDRLDGVDFSEATTLHYVSNVRVAESDSPIESKRLDLGLWLLRGANTRHSQWEQFRRAPQNVAELRVSSLKRSSDPIKRSCDIVISLSFLIVLFPLFIFIAALIKFDSRGPVFFRHYRVGKGGKTFLLWKFRSMRTDAPKYDVSPRSAADIRLTRIGRLIRRLSIDEIPQLINVLRGDMSLVGPRPEMPFIVDLYHSIESERFFARPGITGLWQISPARAFPIHENQEYDLHYVRNQNLFLDCVIILRTITAVIHGIGAV
jgi:lipopolysaccharide/colanic/teichoic acid biosynthesis glycosyltransferase